ncbi:hypothetical protein SASPL_102795 [Salvia splendens]|uniref:3-hydroxyisobutyryl-CoA hydrolase n=1 Tax=Salvia splendens TaxID=180675 RepID=A0A8X8YRY9_SALSN|nr:hypothetical protein SASPL_102795 [Salvia splendens]
MLKVLNYKEDVFLLIVLLSTFFGSTMASTNGETDQVSVKERSRGRIFMLNRPKQLNALSAVMSDIIEHRQKLLIRAIGAWIAGKKESYPFCSWLSSLPCSCVSIERVSSEKKDDWIPSTIQSLPENFFEIEGGLQGIGECLISEFRMVCHVMLGGRKVRIQGCRAILLDKDRNPKWEPSKLESISDEMVNRYLSKLDVVGWEDLKVPVSSKLPAYAIA